MIARLSDEALAELRRRIDPESVSSFASLLSEVTETRALVKELVEALEPFANWARGLAQIEQPDAFTYQCLVEIPVPGFGIDERVITKDVLADDFARTLAALSRARKMREE